MGIQSFSNNMTGCLGYRIFKGLRPNATFLRQEIAGLIKGLLTTIVPWEGTLRFPWNKSNFPSPPEKKKTLLGGSSQFVSG